jgi:hypothetical protein
LTDPFWGFPVATASVSTIDPIIFVEQPQQAAPLAAPSAPASTSSVTWFYCSSPPGYFPYVQNCTQPWIRVNPNAMQPSPAVPQRPAAPPQG